MNEGAEVESVNTLLCLQKTTSTVERSDSEPLGSEMFELNDVNVSETLVRACVSEDGRYGGSISSL